jgi:hypothetical protein
MYKPVSLALGVVAGGISGVVFKRAWRWVSAQEDAPNATDEERDWGEILAAAALHGIIFAIIRAAIDRGGAAGVRRLTGRWPVLVHRS